MNRAQKILELFGDIGGANLRLLKDQKFLQCQSCGYIASFPSGVYGTDGLGDTTRAPLFGEENTSNEYDVPMEISEKCPKCGGPMNEVSLSSSRVMRGGTVGQGYASPGGAYHGGAYSA